MTDVGLKVESAMCYVTPFDRPLSGHGSGGMFHNVRQCSRMLPKYGDGEKPLARLFAASPNKRATTSARPILQCNSWPLR